MLHYDVSEHLALNPESLPEFCDLITRTITATQKISDQQVRSSAYKCVRSYLESLKAFTVFVPDRVIVLDKDKILQLRVTSDDNIINKLCDIYLSAFKYAVANKSEITVPVMFKVIHLLNETALGSASGTDLEKRIKDLESELESIINKKQT
jgi:hypothetical protein